MFGSTRQCRIFTVAFVANIQNTEPLTIALTSKGHSISVIFEIYQINSIMSSFVDDILICMMLSIDFFFSVCGDLFLPTFSLLFSGTSDIQAGSWPTMAGNERKNRKIIYEFNKTDCIGTYWRAWRIPFDGVAAWSNRAKQVSNGY